MGFVASYYWLECSVLVYISWGHPLLLVLVFGCVLECSCYCGRKIKGSQIFPPKTCDPLFFRTDLSQPFSVPAGVDGAMWQVVPEQGPLQFYRRSVCLGNQLSGSSGKLIRSARPLGILEWCKKQALGAGGRKIIQIQLLICSESAGEPVGNYHRTRNVRGTGGHT